ncbi:hypothetical protein ADK58_08160 [Streptomyces sp. XY152]|nr:hypothetical protein ADK58_08160 [Streptomyces sp. XY152]
MEVLQVPAGADPRDPGQGGALGGRQGAVAFAQGALDQPGGLRAHALGQPRAHRPRRPGQHPVDVRLTADHRVEQPAAPAGVTLQPPPQVLEVERLEQIVDDPVPDRAAHRVRLPGGADDHHVAVVPGGPQPGDDVETEQIGQVQVEQHQIGTEFVHGGDRLLTGPRDAHDPEHVEAFDVGTVHPGHPEVVVDHEHTDRVDGRGPPVPRAAHRFRPFRHRAGEVTAAARAAAVPSGGRDAAPRGRRNRPSWPPPAAGERDVHHRHTRADAMTTTSIGSASATVRRRAGTMWPASPSPRGLT